MVRTCPSTMAPPSASASGATSATKTLNIFLESSSPTAETITAKAVGLGTEVFEANRLCHSGVSTPPQFSLDVDVQPDATDCLDLPSRTPVAPAVSVHLVLSFRQRNTRRVYTDGLRMLLQ